MAFRGNVQIDTHQLSARTNLIEVWFREPFLAATAKQPQLPATAVPSTNTSATLNLPDVASNSKLDVTGNEIRLQVALPNPQPVITNLAVDGKVSLKQIAASPNAPHTMQLKAHSLQLSHIHI